MFSLFLAFALMVTSVLGSSLGTLEVQAAEGTLSGSGTYNDPYIIEDAADLKAQHERQHTQQGNAAAVGHGEELDVGKHRANSDHEGAFHQNTGLGIGFGHDEKIPLS